MGSGVFVYYGMGGREREIVYSWVWVDLFMGAEMVSSIVMYNFGVGPWGTLCFKHCRRATK